MRIRLVIASLVIASSLTLIACSQDNAPKTQTTWLTPTPIGLRDDWKIANNTKENGAWVAYYQGKSSLFLKSPQGQPQMLVDGASGAAPSGLALALNQANTPATMWRDKVPSKGLYLKQGESAPLEIGVEGFDTEPLARFDLKADLAGSTPQGWHVLWYGERFVPESNSKYNLYYRHIDAQGTPGTTQRLMPGFYPQWIVGANNEVAVFSWDNTQKPPQVLMRLRDAKDGQFTASKVIATTTPDIPPLFRAFRLADRWFVTWIDQQGESSTDFLLRGMWSDDHGANWKGFDFPTIRGFDIADVRIAHDAGSKHAIMSISGTWRIKDPSASNAFYIAHSADNGATWSEPKIIRDAQAARTSRAEAAQVFFGDEPGSTWVVWEDWRDVRGRLYFSYSENYGESWLHSNLPLAGQPDGNNLIAFNREVSYRDSKGLHLVAENVTSDAGQEKRVFSLPLDTHVIDASAKAKPVSQLSESSLRSRIETYWKFMSEGNFDASYALFDPFMRAAWPAVLYKQRLGIIKYKPEIIIDRVDINGNFADIDLRVRAFVPEFEMAGKKQGAPEREVEIRERWVFIDGNWFREYFEEGSNLRFTRYR
jgi:hypothetical protein